MYKTSKLYTLLNKKEEEVAFIKTNNIWTHLWKYWDEFISISLENWKSRKFLSWVYDILRTIIKHTNLNTIECFNDIRFLCDELSKIRETRNWTPVTYNTYRKNLNSYFLHLERMKYINDNPIKRILKSKEADKSQPITNIEDIKVLLDLFEKEDSIENLRNGLYFKLAILTWARPIELLNLTINSFSSDRKEVRISWAKQNSKERIYRIDTLNELLIKYIKKVSERWRSKELDNYLFISISEKWKPLNSNWINKLYQRLTNKLGFKINTYMIRRFSATQLYKSWVDWHEMMDFLWHTRWATTKKYIQNSSDFTNKATNIMSWILNRI